MLHACLVGVLLSLRYHSAVSNANRMRDLAIHQRRLLDRTARDAVDPGRGVAQAQSLPWKRVILPSLIKGARVMEIWLPASGKVSIP